MALWNNFRSDESETSFLGSFIEKNFSCCFLLAENGEEDFQLEGFHPSLQQKILYLHSVLYHYRKSATYKEASAKVFFSLYPLIFAFTNFIIINFAKLFGILLKMQNQFDLQINLYVHQVHTHTSQ